MSDDAPESEFFRSRRWQPGYDDPPHDDAPPHGEPVDDVQGSKSKPRFRLHLFSDVKPDEGGRDLIKGLFPCSGLAVVWGEPKCGKSFWVFDLLMHVALNWEYRGHRVTYGPIIYCALEGVRGFKNRIEAFRRGKLSQADVDASPPFYLMPASLSLVRDHKELIADIRKQLGDQIPRAVCLDTLNRSLAGSESSDQDMAAGRELKAQWRPSMPRRLSDQEWDEYRAGRDALLAEVAAAIGGNVLVVEA